MKNKLKGRARFTACLVLVGLGYALMGCGNRSEPLENQIDLSKCERVDYIFFQDNTEENCINFSHKFDFYNLNDFYLHTDFYDAAYRVCTYIIANQDDFEWQEVNFVEQEITRGGKAHYVKIQLTEEAQLSLSGQGNDGVGYVLFDADNGNVWLGNARRVYMKTGVLKGKEYEKDDNLLDYIEGKWKPREYNTFIEELVLKNRSEG